MKRLYGSAHATLDLLVIFGSPARSSATPILIESGSLEAVGSFDPLAISLVGERGFTFDAVLSRSQARFDPSGGIAKAPGSQISLGGQWSGTGFLEATATLDGTTYPPPNKRIGGMGFNEPQAFFLLEGFAGTLPLEGTTFTTTAPFTFSGTFSYYLDDTAPPSEPRILTTLTYAGGTLGGPALLDGTKCELPV